MPLMLALPVGSAGGVVLAVAVYLSSNADYRALGGWGAFGYLVGVGAVLGGVTAIGAVAGAVLALLIAGRAARSAGSILAGSIGAGVGAATLWLGIGVASAFASSAGSWFGVSLAFAAVAALVATALAALLLRSATKRRRSPISEAPGGTRTD